VDTGNDLPSTVLDDLVTANRILAREGVVDAFGHVSIRHPSDPTRYFLSRARAPECIEAADLIQFHLDGMVPGAKVATVRVGARQHSTRFRRGLVEAHHPNVGDREEGQKDPEQELAQ